VLLADTDFALETVAAGFGRRLTTEQVSALLRFFQQLLAWNVRINLTGARSLGELVQEHFPDALALDRLVPADLTLVDVGSGGGLPAIPFAVLRPDVPVTLVESRAKRAAFLRAALREVGVPGAVRDVRAEELSMGEFDVASSRATFPPLEWLALGRSLVRPGGRVVIFLAVPPEQLPPGMPEPTVRIDYSLRAGRPRAALAIDVPRGTP
jgi:16S rRNA (guanine527-N7)-methyltransferase